jgi:hypothetical protein
MAKAATTIKHNGDTFQPGDTVTKSKFKDEEWDALVEAGAVQTGDDAPAPTPASTSGMNETDLEMAEDMQGPKEGSKEAEEAAEATAEEQEARLGREGRLP